MCVCTLVFDELTSCSDYTIGVLYYIHEVVVDMSFADPCLVLSEYLYS